MSAQSNLSRGKGVTWFLIILVTGLLLVLLFFVFEFTLKPSPSTITSQNIAQETIDLVLNTQQDVLETIQWIVTIFLGLLTASGIASFWYGTQRIQDFQNQTDQLNERLTNLDTKSKNSMKEWEEKATALEGKIVEFENKLSIRLGEADRHLGEAMQESERINRSLQQVTEKVENEQLRIEDLMMTNQEVTTVLDVERYAVRLFSDRPEDRMNGLLKLIQYSHDDNPIVRRRCVYVFATVPDFPENDIDKQKILERLNELSKDQYRAIRTDAQHALVKFREV